MITFHVLNNINVFSVFSLSLVSVFFEGDMRSAVFKLFLSLRDFQWLNEMLDKLWTVVADESSQVDLQKSCIDTANKSDPEWKNRNGNENPKFIDAHSLRSPNFTLSGMRVIHSVWFTFDVMSAVICHSEFRLILLSKLSLVCCLHSVHTNASTFVSQRVTVKWQCYHVFHAIFAYVCTSNSSHKRHCQ